MEGEQFQCDLCSARTLFPDLEALEEHVIDTHVVDKEFHCKICNKSFVAEEDLQVHAQNCLASAAPLELDPLHTNVRVSPTTAQTSESGVSTRAKKAGAAKMQTQGGTAVLNSRTDSRPFLKTDKKVKNKLKLELSESDPWSCEVCPKQYETFKALVCHRTKTHPKVSRPSLITDGDADKPCKYCPKILSSPVQFNEHTQSHFDDWKRKSQPTLRKEDIQTPPNIAPNNIPVPPQLSSLTKATEFTDEQRRSLTLTKQFKCNYCPKIFFRRNDTFRQHMANVHFPGEKRWKCPHCSATFFRKTGLVTHVAIHTQERPFTCEYCHFAFKTKTVWYGHLRNVHKMKKVNE